MRISEYKKIYEEDNTNCELKLAYFKACYIAFSESDGYRNEIKDRAWFEGVSVELIKRNARIYMTSVLGMNDEDFYDMFYLRTKAKPPVRKGVGNELILNLLGVDDEEKIIELIRESGINLKYIKEHIFDFVCIYYPKKKYLVEVLRDKINIYSEYKKQDKKERKEKKEKEYEIFELEQRKNKYEDAKKSIQNFINDDVLSVKDYCEIYSLSITNFYEYVKIIEIFDNIFYLKYLEVLEEKKLRRDKMIVAKIKKMIYFLENGIECNNGIVRPFDIIDYYQFIGLNINDLCLYLDTYDFSLYEIKLIKTLVDKGKILEKIGSKDWNESEDELIKNIFDSVQEYNCRKNSKGLPILGTGRIINLDEKVKLIEFLREIGAPLTRKNYAIACRRYVNGTLLFNKDEVNIFYKKKFKKILN